MTAAQDVPSATKRIKRVIEIVATNPPADDKLAYYAEQGIECSLIIAYTPFATGIAAQLHHEGVDVDDLPPIADKSMASYLKSFKPGVTCNEYGRAYPDGKYQKIKGEMRAATLTSCPKEYRAMLASEIYTDFDMTAAAPTILSHLAKKYSVRVPFIDCIKREAKDVRNHLAREMDISYEAAKKRINNLLHADETRGNDHDFLIQLRRDACRLARTLAIQPEFAPILAASAHKERPLASMLAKIWMTIEHEMLMAAWGSIKNDPRCVLIFDGMLVPNQHIDLAGGKEALLERFTKAAAEIVPDMKWAVKDWD